MTWGSVWFILVITVVVDALRAFFVGLVFTGPVLIGLLAASYASSSAWLSWVPSSVITAITAGGLGTLEALQPQIAAGVEGFGILMAMVIGLAGLGIVVFMLKKRGVNLAGKNSLRIILAAVGAETPIADALPSLTPLTFLILRDQIKADKKKVAAHKAEQVALRAQVANQQMLEHQQQVLQLQAAEVAQAEQEIQAAEKERVTEEAVAEENEEAVIKQAPPPRPPRGPLVGVPSLMPNAANNDRTIPERVQQVA